LGQGARAPRFTCCPHIQQLADRSDVISEVPKCSKMQIFQGSAPDPLGELTALPKPSSLWGGARCFPPMNPTPDQGPKGLVSVSLTHYRVGKLATPLMIDFKCRTIRSSYFSVSGNGENGLSDEGAEGG